MLRFTICVLGIYACFLTWGVVQERVSTTPYGDETAPKKFKFFIVLNLVQSMIAACVAWLYLKLTNRQLNVALVPRGLYLKYAQVAFLNCIGSPFGYASLKHIDYPTMILGKSCKLVPVMMMNVLVYRRRFPLYKYLCVALITGGVSMFMLYQPTSSAKMAAAANSLWGLFLLGMNLTIDGLTNATQDQIFHTYSQYVSGQHMMFFMNALGSLFSAMYLLLHPYNDELWQAIDFCTTHPAVIRDIVLFGLCGALGQCFIFYTLQRYGSLRLVTVTVTRKLFTMLLSVFWFNHVLSLGQWTGVALVFTAIGLEAYIKKAKAS
ncbi:UAA transporter [Hesseltinella vesiculosa]|uniref:UDP-galactose transporter homolog 1 n=1 Tax=Hesseltinella vesiculosa TaxID=101127 RepID=A0A1X2GR76_9FUNG|nr:UAA transporter [Hesseltinella vesiculosa]